MLLIAAVTALDYGFRPNLEKYCENAALNMAAQAINDAVTGMLAESNIVTANELPSARSESSGANEPPTGNEPPVLSEPPPASGSDKKPQYDGLIEIVRDEQGKIELLRTDTAGVNRLKTRLAEAIAEQLEEEHYRQIQVPVGFLTGVQFLAGRGPKLTYRLQLDGAALVDIQSRFEQAGINQTHYRLYAQIQISVLVLLPGTPVTIEIGNEFLIAETILVGPVPAYVIGMN